MIEDIETLPLPKDIITRLKEMGIHTLYPPQREALEYVLKGNSLVLSVPTASGKSLVAYLAILRGLLNGGKGLYIVPLRALATEKFEDIRSLLPAGYRTVLSIGDYGETDKRLMNYDVIVATCEKADSLFRHRPDFLREFSVVVADEVHLITIPERGHILEVLLTRLKQLSPDTQLIALSATIPNSLEIADWLGAAHLKSDWRPISLKEGVYQGGIIRFPDEEREIKKGSGVKNLVKDALRNGGQCLVFVNTRRSTETEAKRLIPSIRSYIDEEKLEEISQLLINTQNEPTEMVERLATCVEGGTGFHHAGLGNTQRRIIERAFKEGYIKTLVATPTLAAGINLPARRVIIRDLYRYTGKITGNQPIPNLELKQMAGRAGRPGYDPYGEAIFMARNEDDADRVIEEVIHGETERIESKLGVAPILRIHIISSIASGFVHNYSELIEFFNLTFYAHQFEIREGEVKEALRFLRENGMLLAPSKESKNDFVTADRLKPMAAGFTVLSKENKNDFVTADRLDDIEETELRVTPFGKLTSDLYIDPKSAVVMRRGFENSDGKVATSLSYLHVISATPDMLNLYVREGEIGDLFIEAELHRDELFFSPADRDIYGDNEILANEFFAEELKTALLLDKWVDEINENTLTKIFNIGPGDLRNRVDTARWLLHAMERIAALYHYDHRELNKLIRRITYGVKEELLPLVSLKGVGRIRARFLFNNGYRNTGHLKKADINDLLNIEGIGKATVFRIMDQLGRDTSEIREADQEIRRLQRTLSEFGI